MALPLGLAEPCLNIPILRSMPSQFMPHVTRLKDASGEGALKETDRVLSLVSLFGDLKSRVQSWQTTRKR